MYQFYKRAGKVLTPQRLPLRLLPSQLAKTTGTTAAPRRSYNFAANNYAGCFGNLEKVDSAKLRQQSVEEFKTFDETSWFSNPIVTHINGEAFAEGTEVVTQDAFGKDNGKLVQSPPETVDRVISHMRDYMPLRKDYREEVRALEQKLLHSHYASTLVVNQAKDFLKQDGITEMEESAEANTVERRLNDLLLADEEAGILTINRAPALIGCVSNFSNFLDLFRKTIRNIELGVPAVVLSRSNTTQHVYRWFVMLQELMKEHGVDAGMLTFASCDITQQRRIMSSNPDSPLFFTGSRPISEAIKEICPKLMSSTGGPNTLVTTTWTPSIAQAVSLSASIENSGQCTALRHLVAPPNTANIEDVLKIVPKVQTPAESLSAGGFAAVFEDGKFETTTGYTVEPSIPAAYKVSTSLPGDDIDEMWRQVYIDVTETDFTEPHFSDSLGKWLIHHAPISLAVNAEDFPKAFELARGLFEKSSMVVYTVGAVDAPALTAQARPQDGEIFGEFPPRDQLSKYTKFPVVGPGSSPSLNSTYTDSYLVQEASSSVPEGFAYCEKLFALVKDVKTRGYLNVLLKYLCEAANGPRVGGGVRTALWGLQRSPLLQGGHTVIRTTSTTTFDDVLVSALPFIVTNARSQMILSIGPDSAIKEQCAKLQEFVTVAIETDADFAASTTADKPWNLITLDNTPTSQGEYSLVGSTVSCLFPLGHIKSTRPGDSEFIDAMSKSEKWLRVLPC